MKHLLSTSGLWLNFFGEFGIVLRFIVFWFSFGSTLDVGGCTGSWTSLVIWFGKKSIVIDDADDEADDEVHEEVVVVHEEVVVV